MKIVSIRPHFYWGYNAYFINLQEFFKTWGIVTSC